MLLSQGEKLCTAFFKVSFNKFLSFKALAGQNMFFWPLVPVNNRLVLH